MVKSLPSGNFEEISIHTPDWQTTFLSLVQQGKLIKYDVFTMPVIPENIKDELRKNSYHVQVVEENHDQFFLIPKT